MGAQLVALVWNDELDGTGGEGQMVNDRVMKSGDGMAWGMWESRLVHVLYGAQGLV